MRVNLIVLFFVLVALCVFVLVYGVWIYLKDDADVGQLCKLFVACITLGIALILLCKSGLFLAYDYLVLNFRHYTLCIVLDEKGFQYALNVNVTTGNAAMLRDYLHHIISFNVVEYVNFVTESVQLPVDHVVNKSEEGAAFVQRVEYVENTVRRTDYFYEEVEDVLSEMCSLIYKHQHRLVAEIRVSLKDDMTESELNRVLSSVRIFAAQHAQK